MSHDPHAPDTPTPDPVEERLRAALRAEADRHPVNPDLAGLRDRTDGAVIDLRLAPRRNRARLVAAAAVVALVVAAAGVVVALQTDEDRGEPVLTDQPPATGYYLPGPGWEVKYVHAMPAPAFPGSVRSVHFAAPDFSSPDSVVPGSVAVSQVAVEGDALDLLTLAEEGRLDSPRPIARGEGDDTREYIVSGFGEVGSAAPDDRDDRDDREVPEGVTEPEGGSVVAQRDDQLLLVDWYAPVTEDDALALVDRWWTSGGAEIALDRATGLVRAADVTYRNPEPAAAGELVMLGALDDVDAEAFYEAHYADAPVQVMVTVEAPGGWTGAYTVLAPGGPATTGAGEDDGGAAAGLGPDEVGGPLPATVGGPGPAWESGTGITADLPEATVGVALVSYIAEPVTRERARELWAALGPVSRDAWVAAQPQDSHLPEDTWADTLADTRVADDWATEEEPVDDDSSDAIEMPEPFSLEARDGVNPATGRTPEEVDRIVADALLAFVGGGGPVDADLFAPAVTFWSALNPGQGGPVAIEDVAAVVPYEAPPDEVTPAIEAWTMLTTVGSHPRAEPVGEVAGCGGLEELAADPGVVVILKPLAADEEPRCGAWNALVVTLDDQRRIAEVEARSGP